MNSDRNLLDRLKHQRVIASLVLGCVVVGLLFLTSQVRTLSTPDSENAQDATDRSAPSSTVYTITEENVIAIDAKSGDLLGEVPRSRTGGVSQSPFLAVHKETDRLFVADAFSEDGRLFDMLTVIDISNWTVEHQEPVPNVIRYIGGSPRGGIVPSSDGEHLYVYNYNDRTLGDEPVRYWLTVYDVERGEWLDHEVELPGCGGATLLSEDDLLYVVCSGVEVLLVDPAHSDDALETYRVDVVRKEASPHRGPRIATAMIHDGAMYVLTENRELHILDLESGEWQIRDGTATEYLSVFSSAITISQDGRELYIPSGTFSQRSEGKASEITAVDLESGEIGRSIELDSSWYMQGEFGHDADGSFAVFSEESQSGSNQFGPLVRLDLATGEKTTLHRDPVQFFVVAGS